MRTDEKKRATPAAVDALLKEQAAKYGLQSIYQRYIDIKTARNKVVSTQVMSVASVSTTLMKKPVASSIVVSMFASPPARSTLPNVSQGSASNSTSVKASIEAASPDNDAPSSSSCSSIEPMGRRLGRSPAMYAQEGYSKPSPVDLPSCVQFFGRLSRKQAPVDSAEYAYQILIIDAKKASYSDANGKGPGCKFYQFLQPQYKIGASTVNTIQSVNGRPATFHYLSYEDFDKQNKSVRSLTKEADVVFIYSVGAEAKKVLDYLQSSHIHKTERKQVKDDRAIIRFNAPHQLMFDEESGTMRLSDAFAFTRDNAKAVTTRPHSSKLPGSKLYLQLLGTACDYMQETWLHHGNLGKEYEFAAPVALALYSALFDIDLAKAKLTAAGVTDTQAYTVAIITREAHATYSIDYNIKHGRAAINTHGQESRAAFFNLNVTLGICTLAKYKNQLTLFIEAIPALRDYLGNAYTTGNVLDCLVENLAMRRAVMYTMQRVFGEDEVFQRAFVATVEPRIAQELAKYDACAAQVQLCFKMKVASFDYEKEYWARERMLAEKTYKNFKKHEKQTYKLVDKSRKLKEHIIKELDKLASMDDGLYGEVIAQLNAEVNPKAAIRRLIEQVLPQIVYPKGTKVGYLAHPITYTVVHERSDELLARHIQFVGLGQSNHRITEEMENVHWTLGHNLRLSFASDCEKENKNRNMLLQRISQFEKLYSALIQQKYHVLEEFVVNIKSELQSARNPIAKPKRFTLEAAAASPLAQEPARTYVPSY